jgi:hypothetical protein
MASRPVVIFFFDKNSSLDLDLAYQELLVSSNGSLCGRCAAGWVGSACPPKVQEARITNDSLAAQQVAVNLLMLRISI